MALPAAWLGLPAFQNTGAIHSCHLMPASLWPFLCYCSPSKIIPQPKLASETGETLARGLHPDPLGFQEGDPEMGRDLQGRMENLKSRFLPCVQFLGNCPHLRMTNTACNTLLFVYLITEGFIDGHGAQRTL